MKTVTENVSGNLEVTEDTTFHHLAASDVTIAENVVARLFGTISHRLQVEKNAIVYLHGQCNGEIINEGGIIYRFLPSGIVDRMEAPEK